MDAPAGPSPNYRYRFADVEYDESSELLRVSGAEVELEPRPRSLLAELLRRPGEVISKDELLDVLWEGRPTVDNVLANAVTKLRRALGEAGGERIVNLPRVGYKFTGPVERVAVGQHGGLAVTLERGQRVPQREAFTLEHCLGVANASPVWLARDPKLGLLRVFKFASDSERLTSLKREYTLYRVLRSELGEREDFAKVLAANFADAPYFLECEYGGQDLLAWAAEADRLAAMPLAERLALFLQIARAVAAAHGVGVLHKDLKPANVLISPDGEGWIAKLTDFGSSRLLEPGRLAALGVTAMGLTMTHGVGSDAMSGTPLYLAPELLAGHSPTTQSDLYALGLMLYQLLVGDLRRPMATGWQREIADELLREDLVAATEGKPEDRLGSVAELVERLSALEARRADRALRSQEAKRLEEAAARWQKSRARRPWLVGAFASLALGLALSVWFYTRANDALRQAEQASARAASINDFLNKDVIQSTDVIQAGTSKAVSMLEVLRRASARASERFKGQPRAEAEVRFQLGKTYLRMASITDASNELLSAMALLKPLVPPNEPTLLALRLTLVDLDLRTLDPQDLAAATALLEETERDAGPALLNGNNEVAFLAARAHFELLQRPGHEGPALPVGQRMLALADSVPALDAAARFEARQSLAELYLKLGRAEEANALLKQILDSPDAAAKVGEVVFARAGMSRAWALRAAGNKSQCEAEFVAVCARLLRTMGPGELQYGLAEFELARMYHEDEKSAEAETALKAALRAFAASLGEQHQYFNVTAVNLASETIERGRPAEALALLDKVAPWFATHTTRRFVQLDLNRGMALNKLHRPAEALSVLDSLKNTDFGHDDEAGSQRWLADAERAQALLALGRRAEGTALLREAIALGERASAKDSQLAPYRARLPGS